MPGAFPGTNQFPTGTAPFLLTFKTQQIAVNGYLFPSTADPTFAGSPAAIEWGMFGPFPAGVIDSLRACVIGGNSAVDVVFQVWSGPAGSMASTNRPTATVTAGQKYAAVDATMVTLTAGDFVAVAVSGVDAAHTTWPSASIRFTPTL